MKRLGIALALWALLCANAGAQLAGGLQFPGPGTPHSAGVAFQGIGDVKTTGWKAVYGTAAFSAATRGTKLINACDSTGGVDVSCADMLSDATTGDIVPQVIGGITCPSANCTVKIFYDLSGALACTGSTACDMTQATVANRAKLTATALGGASTKTCAVSNGTSSTYTAPVLTSSIGPPFNVTSVVKYTSGGQFFFGSGSGTSVGFGAFSGFFAFFAPSVVNGAASDTSSHAIQYINNSASSFIVVDTTTGSTGSSGGTNINNSAGMLFFTDGFARPMNGVVCQMGLNNAAAWNGTDATNLYNNEHTYWGF